MAAASRVRAASVTAKSELAGITGSCQVRLPGRQSTESSRARSHSAICPAFAIVARQSDDPGRSAAIAHPREQSLQDWSSSRVPQHVNLVHHERPDLGQRITECRRAANGLELLRGGHPQVGPANPLDVDGVLTGQPFYPQPLLPPAGELAVQLVSQGTLWHQPRRLAPVLDHSPQRGGHPYDCLARTSRRDHQEVVVMPENLGQCFRLGWVQSPERQEGNQLRGDQLIGRNRLSD